MTAACVVIDPRDGTVLAAAAGHPPPLYWDHAQGRLVTVSDHGPALGLVPDWGGPTARWRLAPWDTLILYTDGVLDAKLNRTERLGEARLAELLGRGAPASAAEWVGRLQRVLEDCLERPDDVTVVAIGREPGGSGEFFKQLVASAARAVTCALMVVADDLRRYPSDRPLYHALVQRPGLDAAGADTGETVPVWSIAPESVIVSPAPGQSLERGTLQEVWGWAWADRGIDRVEVSVDSGKTWRGAQMEPRAERAWQRFALSWAVTGPGPVVQCSQAFSGGRLTA